MSETFTEQQRDQYIQEWTKFMVDFWQERIMKLHVHDTGALANSFRQTVTDGSTISIAHTFLEYGIYQAAGVGNHYAHDNGGNLSFLDPEYREAHGLNKPRKRGPKWGGGYTSGKPRKPRDWFSRKYFYSIHRLNEKMAQYYGEAYQGLLFSALDDLFDSQSKLRSL